MSKASWTFTPLAIAVLVLQGLAIAALLLTGSWGNGVPAMLKTVNPLFTWLDGERQTILPISLFSGHASPLRLHAAANLYVFATLQWLGAGLVLDLLKNRRR